MNLWVSITVMFALVNNVYSVSPYLVLDLDETATKTEVVDQYKKLKKKLKKSETKMGILYDAAYK